MTKTCQHDYPSTFGNECGDCEDLGLPPANRDGMPVTPAVTERIVTLLEDARSALAQALYEGSHTRRQDPAPTHGSPWTTPDLPAEVHLALVQAQDAVAMAMQKATRARLLD